MKKRWLCLILAAVMLLTAGVGSTFAWLISSSNTVENTFTVGRISIALTETTGSHYKTVPGAAVKKDPRLTVTAGSEDCWLFVRIRQSESFDRYASYSAAEGWIPLEGHPGVYYRKVSRSTLDQTFLILKDDSILIRDAVTETVMAEMTVLPTLTFTGYAVQRSGIATAEEAWRLVAPPEGGAEL